MKEIKNSLMKRREVIFELEAKSNPGFEHASKMLSSELKVNPENIIVKQVRGNFGSSKFTITALVYDSKEDKERIEPKPKVKKVEAAAGGAK